MPSSNARLRTLACLLVAVAGCTGASSSRGVGDSAGPSTTGSGASSGGTIVVDGTGTGTAITGSAGSTGTGGTGSVVVPPGGTGAGALTAGTWDDNLNFDFYLSYLKRIDPAQIYDLPRIPRDDRLEILVTDAAGQPLGNATVTVSGAAGKLLEAPTRPDGKLFFFPGAVGAPAGEDLQITAALGAATATAVAKVGDPTSAISLPGTSATPARALDLALVIDTTGSMGDELEYLKVEVSAIAGQVAQAFPDVAQRLALILYRDDGDEYVVRSFDFTTSLATFQAQIAAQAASGGGDWPESPDKALAKLTTLAWGRDTVARMAFWIADAPHHAGRSGLMATDILTAQGLGVRLYPISASGADDVLEYTMRTAAEITGGRYLFLTDDSGIGNAHKEPTIPCYVVTSLDKAMLRMISMELTGTEIQPAAADVIRTSGSPEAGRCKLADGQEVRAL